METKGRKSLNHYMRALHRDIGFFVIGLTIIFCLSGIVLIYRNTGFLKFETIVEETFAPNLTESELWDELPWRDFKITRSEGDVDYFEQGTYNRETGAVKYTTKRLPGWISSFNSMHRASSSSMVHWFSLLYGVLLLFLAISSFWMFKPKSKLFRRGLVLAAAGVVLAIAVLFL